MPIKTELLKKMPEELLTHLSNSTSYYLIEFLKNNQDEAYTKEEILKAIQSKPLIRGKIGKNTVYNLLNKYYHDKHKPIYKKGIYFYYEENGTTENSTKFKAEVSLETPN